MFLVYRKFELHLKREVNVLTPGFQVYAIDKLNNARRVDVDASQIYHGTLAGNYAYTSIVVQVHVLL